MGSVTDEATKQDLICELDACVAHLYGLDEDDLAVVYETFHEGADYSQRHRAVLAHSRRITDYCDASASGSGGTGNGRAQGQGGQLPQSAICFLIYGKWIHAKPAADPEIAAAG